MSEVDKVLAEAAEKIRKDAFFEGWNACLAAIMDAVEKASPEGGLAAPTIIREPNVGEVADGPKMGTTPYYVLNAIRKLPGMTGAQVVLAVLEGGHRVAEAQIRTAISRLQKRSLIVNRHKKWFPS